MEDEHGKQIENEMNLWYEFDHPNVIKMYGASHVSSPPFIVCEDATSGDLASFLARSESNKRRTWSLLYQAALGLQYLHSKKVVHGDLKLNNILVSADGQAKVSDFGCAMRISENGCPTTRATFGRGGLRWRAPECLTQAPTFASDVYSFAMCIIEAVSGEPPFTFLDDDSVLEMVKNGAIPDKPGDMLTEGWELVMAMANRDPSKRAALSYVIDKLNKLAEDEERMKKPQHEEVVALESPRRTEDSTFDTMGVLDLVAEVSAGRETEEALRYLLRASINDEQRALMYKINGVQKLISLLKVEQSYFAQLFVLQCLKWSMVADSMLTTPEFEEIRKRIRKASKSEVELVVADLKTGSDQEKEKAVVLCACIATRGDTDSLFKVGAVQPLVALLRENDVQKLWAAEALGNIATESDAIRAQIVQGEAIASLVALILVGTEDQKHRAAYALGNLALSKDANELIVRRGVIGPLVGLVHTGTRQQKTTAEVALENLVRVTYSNPVDIAREQSTDPLIALVQVGSVEQKDSAACALMAIARTNDALRADIERDGGVSLFIALLRAGSDEEKNYAACKLRDLAVKDAARVQIVREGGIALLVVLLRSGTNEQKKSAAHALMAITKFNEAARIDTVIEQGIEPLISLVRDGTDKQKGYAAGVLANIARSKEAWHDNILRAGGITPLLVLLQSGTSEQKNFAVSALGNILTSSNGATRAEIAYEGGFTLLTALVRAGSEQQKANAACALMVLARSNDEVRADVARKGGVRLLISLVRNGTDQQKIYAVNALGDLAFNDPIREEVALERGIPPLVGFLRTGSDHLKASVMETLKKLSANGKICKEIASNEDPLHALLETGTDQQKDSATDLIKILGDLKAH